MSEEKVTVAEKKANFFDRLKDKWGIESNLQVAIIFVVFALTGFSAVEARKLYFIALGFDENTVWLAKASVWLIMLFPTYQILLLFWGTLFGQFQFFWEKEKKMMQAFGRIFRKK